MKVQLNRPTSTITYLTILIILICCSKNHGSFSGKNSPLEVNDSFPSTNSLIDTTLRLKFSSGIRAILEDSHGNIWFGSHQEGVCLFDGKTFTYFTIEDGLSDQQVRSIFEDADGRVWFEGGKGISSYDGTRIMTATTIEKNYLSKQDWQMDKNDLWFKGDEMTGYNTIEGQPGVYRYHGHFLTYHVFPLKPKEVDDFYYSVSTPFCRGKNGRVWFGTYGAVIGYNGIQFVVIDDEHLGLTEETGYLHVRSLFEDSQGNLWIGNNGIGVLLYDGDTTINFSKLHGLVSENSLHRGGYRSPPGSLEHVFSIGEDNQGNLWFGDRDTGAWRYDGKSLENYTTKDGLTTSHIWQIYKSKKGELWFAMGDGSVCRFNGKSFDRIF